MELLGFQNITLAEESLILEKLSFLIYQPMTLEVENIAIHVRRTYRVKLPDAIIAATALAAKAQLLTFDQKLQRVLDAERVSWY